MVYFLLALWAVTFIVFPPVSFSSGVETSTRIIWNSMILASALVALFGSITGRDLKVELVAIFPLLAGPGLYFLGLLWYVFFPDMLPPGTPSDPAQRIALTVFALYATVSLLPRLCALLDKRKQTRLAIEASTATTLTEAQAAQPGAFPEFSKGDPR